jgi:ribosomal protein S18 acetylase RimI-like enzyme
MIKAAYNDRYLVVDILARAFDDNKSVNYTVRQDEKRALRIKRLMQYSFDVCYRWGEVYLSDNKNGCALVLLPDRRKTNLKSILLDLKLVISCVSIGNIKKMLERESEIKKLHPDNMYHIWFIGVDPAQQNNGTGSALLGELIRDGLSTQRTICLETSTLKNIPWYQKFGFRIYNELDLGYRLYFFKYEPGLSEGVV